MNNRRRKTSLEKYLYLSLYCKGSKRVTQGLRVRGSWRSNRNCNILTLTLMAVTLCLSCSSDAQSEPWGPLCWVLAFFTASYQHLLWTPIHQGPKPHRPGVAFPTTSRLHWNSNSTGSSNSTVLYNRSTPNRSLKSNV